MKDQGWRAIGIVDPGTRGPRDSWTPGLADPGTRGPRDSRTPGLAHINRPFPPFSDFTRLLTRIR